MDTIAKHHKRLASRYVPRHEAKEIIASARHLIELVLRSEHLHLRHRKKMISEALWWISEADGKHTTRYRSEEVVRLAQTDPTSGVKIQHEHVHPRKKVAEELLGRGSELLERREELDCIIAMTVGCIVTAAQHKKLKGGVGWARYNGVVVLDMSTLPPTVKPISEC